MARLRLAFMGSPDFAVPALRALHGEHDVVAVYCQPPRPAGRGDLRCGHVDLRDLVRAEAPRQGAQSLFVVVGYGLERGPGVICKECGRGEREEERES